MQKLLGKLYKKKEKSVWDEIEPKDIPIPEPYYNRMSEQPRNISRSSGFNTSDSDKNGTTSKGNSPIDVPMGKPIIPLPVIYTKDKERFVHFANCFAEVSDPLPVVLLTYRSIHLINAPIAQGRRIALILTPRYWDRAIDVLSVFEKKLYGIVMTIEVDMLFSRVRGQDYFILRNWCLQRSIRIGAYIYQGTEHLYVPCPRYDSYLVSCFHFYILDSAVKNKYDSVKYMSSYLHQLGISTTAVVPLYIPDAPISIRDKNYAGYFFRDDLCESNARRLGNTKGEGRARLDLPYFLK